MADDLLDSSYYQPLFGLLRSMDRDIQALYADRGEELGSTRFVGPLISLGRQGPMTVKALAKARRVTHSAMSQTVAAMVRDGLVDIEAGADARTRVVRLTERSRRLVPLLESEWRATEAVVRELDEEVNHPLMVAVTAILQALETRSFSERLRARLADESSESR